MKCTKVTKAFWRLQSCCYISSSWCVGRIVNLPFMGPKIEQSKGKRTLHEDSSQPGEHAKRTKGGAEVQVVKLRRQKGKIVQDCDIYIGRRITQGGWNLPQSKWHNPFKRKNASLAARQEAIAQYEEYLLRSPELMNSLHELKGKTLGCWCKISPGMPCHGDVLKKLVDQL